MAQAAAFVLYQIHSSKKWTLGWVDKDDSGNQLLQPPSLLSLCSVCKHLFCFLWLTAASREYFCPHCILFFPVFCFGGGKEKTFLQQGVSSSQLKDAAIERELLKEYSIACLGPFPGTTWDFLVGRVHIACQRQVPCFWFYWVIPLSWNPCFSCLSYPPRNISRLWLSSWLVVVVMVIVVVIMADIAKNLRR